MIIKLLAQILFFVLAGLVGLYSAIMVYVLIRFGRSKLLALAISIFFVIIMVILYSVAATNFDLLTFPNI